jgi:hypothetical protein
MSPAVRSGNKGVSVPAGMSAPSVGGLLTRYPVELHGAESAFSSRRAVMPSWRTGISTDLAQITSRISADFDEGPG